MPEGFEPHFTSWDIAPDVALGAILPLELNHCGIYVLHFENGDAYVGQSVNVINRFGQHRRRWSDIVRFAFMPVPAEALNEAEQAIVTELERSGKSLRNITLIGMSVGASALDLVVDRQVQTEWLSGVTDDVQIGLRGEEAQKRRAAVARFEELRADPDFDALADALATYVRQCIPWPHDTERRFWSVTTLPSTGRTKQWRRLAVINIHNVEALVLGEGRDAKTGENWIEGFFNVARNTDVPEELLEIGEERTYRTTGPVISMYFSDPDHVRQILEYPSLLAGARSFAMGLMKKGSGMQGRYHDYHLADEIFLRLEAGKAAG